MSKEIKNNKEINSSEPNNFYKKKLLKFAEFVAVTLFAAVIPNLYSKLATKIGLTDEEFDKQLITIISSIQFFVISLTLFLPAKFYQWFLGKEFQKPYLPLNDNTNAMEACGYTDSDKWGTAKKNAVADLKLYNYYWKFLWFSWLFQYAVLGFLQSEYIVGKGNNFSYNALNILFIFLNNTSAVFMLFCYFVLKQSGDNKKATAFADDIPKRIKINSSGWIALTLAFTIFEISAVIITGNENDGIGKMCGGISGIFAGVVTALYTGRLDSKFLNYPVWLLVALYAYAAIQPLIVIFSGINALPSMGTQKIALTAIIITATLIFKVLLFIYMMKVFYNGRLLFYFVKTRLLDEKIREDWREFNKILIRE